MTLRQELERRVGRLQEEEYERLLQMALDDQRQYVSLASAELKHVLELESGFPGDAGRQRLAEVRARMLDSMVTLADILRRHRMEI